MFIQMYNDCSSVCAQLSCFEAGRQWGVRANENIPTFSVQSQHTRLQYRYLPVYNIGVLICISWPLAGTFIGLQSTGYAGLKHARPEQCSSTPISQPAYYNSFRGADGGNICSYTLHLTYYADVMLYLSLIVKFNYCL